MMFGRSDEVAELVETRVGSDLHEDVIYDADTLRQGTKIIAMSPSKTATAV